MIGHLADTITLLSAMAAGSLINAIGEGIILAAVVSICLRLFPVVKPASRFVIWTAVLFAVVAFHFVPGKSGFESPQVVKANLLHLDARWSLAIACIWGMISLTRVLRLIRSAFHLHRIAADATPVAPEPSCVALLRRGRRPALLCTSTEVDRPSVVGFFHPRVLLPYGILSEISSYELEQIIMHEMEHLRRGDDWTNLIQKISLALFPLNPALNWIERYLCMERELACDDCVLNSTSAHKAYASCLTNLAEHSLLRRKASLALGAWEKKSELSHRVHRILSRPKSSLSRTAGYAVTGVFIAGLLGGAISLARVPMLVSFSSPVSDTRPTGPTGFTAANVALPVSHSQKFSPKLVKAVIPESQQTFVGDRVRSNHTASKIRISSPQSRRRPRNLLALTGSERQAALPRLVLTVSDDNGSSYAAVPVGNGWLVIQL